MQSALFETPILVEEASDLDRLAAGDFDAIARAYDQHHEALCAFARRLLGDVQAAEDLVHDVFVLLPTVVHRLEAGRSLRGFLMGIAANRAKHVARSASRQRQALGRIANELEQACADPDSELDQRWLVNALERALARISLDQRIVFVLCAVEGRDTVNVAETLGIAEATVRTRLFYARKKLRVLLAKEGFK